MQDSLDSLDSTLWVTDSRDQIPYFLSVDLAGAPNVIFRKISVWKTI